MTTAQAKKDAQARLQAANIPFQSLQGKSVSFEGFGYGIAAFITVKGIDFQVEGTPAKWDEVRNAIPKPSQGGYILKSAH